ncbi:MAG: hypothetical protein HY711_09015 [Candidatus Melainabacteria bacterium]|nr:hypothetical protein [Candidatus Melainabacteria bacterium]
MHILKSTSLRKASAALMPLVSLLMALGMTGCTTEPSTTTNVTPQGTVSLDALKVGMPENTFKDSILTFVPDPKGALAGKVQYLSRTNNANGGQVIAQCMDGKCFQLQVYHLSSPISKDTAIKSMRSLLPSDAPNQSKVDDSELKKGKAGKLTEVYSFGDSYLGELTYTDPAGAQVTIVNVWALKQ